MGKGIALAVVGASGLVGRAMLSVLEQRKFPLDQLYLLASSRSAGEIIDYADKPYYIEDLAEFDFSKVQIALSSPGASVSY
jgi:aspartate-semialdehyde dehydrogenase